MQCERLEVGLRKIDEASVQIEQLRIIVTDQRVEVVAAAEKCEQMLFEIGKCNWFLIT